MKVLKLTTATTTASLLFTLNALASSNTTVCGDYYINRTSNEVYTITAGGTKRTMGSFAKAPELRYVGVYPGYMEETVALRSGVTFLIRTSKGSSSTAMMFERGQSWDLGICSNASAQAPAQRPFNRSTIGYEGYSAN